MIKILEGFIKNHFSWEGRPLSRRDFFLFLFPLKGKRCRGCGEERAVGGPYCSLCAKRQLYEAHDGPQVPGAPYEKNT